MASDKEKDTDTEPTEAEPTEGVDPSASSLIVAGDAGPGEVVEGEHAVTSMGSRRYVHAAFLALGILFAYVGGKFVELAWNNLADWPEAVHRLPALVAYPEETRESISLVVGAVLGAAIMLRMYSKASVRGFADEVAAELTKVTWPNREAVLNGTVVVIVASAIATVYVAVLDRFWSFLTTLVYGA
jgi:preprotein translocase subunit SecE